VAHVPSGLSLRRSYIRISVKIRKTPILYNVLLGPIVPSRTQAKCRVANPGPSTHRDMMTLTWLQMETALERFVVRARGGSVIHGQHVADELVVL
jgi:hypothetical protein